MLYHPERLLIDERVLNLPVTRRVMANLPDLTPELTFELISHRSSAKAKQIILERFPRCRLDLDEASRHIKYGRYGRKKFVYPAGEFNQLMYEVRASIERFFPAAKVEYQV